MGNEITESEVAAGTQYCFRNIDSGTGEIWESESSLRWRYRPPESPLNVLNGFRGPNFILFDSQDREVLRIERTRTFPHPSFVLIREGSARAQIQKVGLFSFSYRVSLNGGSAWDFQIPMFTVDFKGTSEKGGKVRVRFETELVWYVLIDKGEDSHDLVAILAFLHSERCRT